MDDPCCRPAHDTPMLDSIVKARGGTTVTTRDSAELRAGLPGLMAKLIGGGAECESSRRHQLPRHHRVSGDRDTRAAPAKATAS